MGTYILSYPSSRFFPAGVTQPAADTAHRALQQWLELCDQITRAGGRILVLDPASADVAGSRPEGLAESVYAARIGAPFLTPATGTGAVFLRARGASEGPPAEQDPVCAALRVAGLAVQVAQHRWQGQAEVVALPRNRFLLTYGPLTDPASCDEVRRLLPMGAHVLCVETAQSPGLRGIAHFTTKGGASALLVDPRVLRSHSADDIGKFVLGGQTELFILGAEDAAIHATEALGVKGTLLMPAGASTALRGNLARRGFQIVGIDVSALFGPDGGGPRMLCNDWHGFVLSDDSPSYATRRDELFTKLEQYGSSPAS